MPVPFYRYSYKTATSEMMTDRYRESKAENIRCVKYIEDENTGFYANAYKDTGIDIKLTVNEKKYYVNGEERMFDVEAQVENERTLVPLRALAEALGKEVQWDNSGLIIITYPKAGFESSKFEWLNSFNHEEMLKILNLFN